MQDRTVIITGGNRGIGLGLTKVFAEAGYNVIVGSRTNLEPNNDISSELKSNIHYIETNVQDEEAHQKLVTYALEKTGRLDVYINNAGFSKWAPINEITEDDFNNMINTNLKGVFWGCKAASAAMQNGACIINISSIAGKRGSTNNALYCATKFGVNGLTQSLAKELGPRHIRVNAICPVLIETKGLKEALTDKHAPAEKLGFEQFMKNFADSNAAFGRLPTAEEVGNTCLFLASEQASAITGQCLNVDCGVFPQ